MENYPLPVPNTTAQAFNEYNTGHVPDNQNPGLVFERFVPDWSDHADTLKEKGLQAVLNASEHTSQELLSAWNMRWQAFTKGALTFSLQTDWRLVAGLGKKGSLEIGFTFHRYGFPYLPGSSMKGLARASALLQIGGKIGKPGLESLHEQVVPEREKKKIGLLGALENVLSRPEETTFQKEFTLCSPTAEIMELARTFRIVFGTTEHGGHVTFFDAIPSKDNSRLIELDIMNPHYPDYYKETGQEEVKTPPANWQSPIPVKFLVVAPGATFHFAVGWRSAPIDRTPLEDLPEKARSEWSWFKGATAPIADKRNPVLEQARQWLEDGLRNLGAGGKTNAGYGYFISSGERVSKQRDAARQKSVMPVGYERGIVKDFELGDNHSYGHITRSNGEKLFVHKNNLRTGLSTLQEGQHVIFRPGVVAGKPQALDVYLEE